MHSLRYRIFFLLPLLMVLTGVLPNALAQAPAASVIVEHPSLPMLGIPPNLEGSMPAVVMSAPPAKVYDAGALAPAGYAILRRVSAASWLSAITVRTYGTEQVARQALLDTAAREGGDGVMHMQCLRSAGPGGGALLRGYYCYGNIIKLK